MDNQHRRITGYRELSEQEIAVMNEVKALAGQVGALIERLDEAGETPVQLEVDGRWLAIAKTDLQKGFMALTRAVAKPSSF